MGGFLSHVTLVVLSRPESYYCVRMGFHLCEGRISLLCLPMCQVKFVGIEKSRSIADICFDGSG